MSANLATKSELYLQPVELTQYNPDTNYTGVIVPDDLRVQLPLRIAALDAQEQVVLNAITFCKLLPIVKVPDSVYVDDGDIVLYWKTSAQGNVLAVIDASYFHYFVRSENGPDLHESNIEIDEKAGYKLRPYLPPHPLRQSRDASSRRN